jgi:hypothetical protein
MTDETCLFQWRCSTCGQWVSSAHPGHVHAYTTGFGAETKVDCTMRRPTDEVRPNPAVNSRYVAYCRAESVDDSATMLALDRERWPGGPMCGFMCWVQKRWNEWYAATGWPRDAPKGQPQHDEFDAWLAQRVAQKGRETT